MVGQPVVGGPAVAAGAVIGEGRPGLGHRDHRLQADRIVRHRRAHVGVVALRGRPSARCSCAQRRARPLQQGMAPQGASTSRTMRGSRSKQCPPARRIQIGAVCAVPRRGAAALEPWYGRVRRWQWWCHGARCLDRVEGRALPWNASFMTIPFSRWGERESTPVRAATRTRRPSALRAGGFAVQGLSRSSMKLWSDVAGRLPGFRRVGAPS